MRSSISGGPVDTGDQQRIRHGGQGQLGGPIRAVRARNRASPYDLSPLRQRRPWAIADYIQDRTTALTATWIDTPCGSLPPFPQFAQDYFAWVLKLLEERPRNYHITLACLETLDILLRVVGPRMPLQMRTFHVLSLTSWQYRHCPDPKLREAAAGIWCSLYASLTTEVPIFPLVCHRFTP